MDILEGLLDLYQHNPYILGKLNAYMANLPTMLHSMDLAQLRKEATAAQTMQFLELNTAPFYYLPTRFIKYDNYEFAFISEDDIVHELFQLVNGELALHSSRHQIGKAAIKLIKSKHLFDTCTPSKQTTKRVIRSVYPAVFGDKHAAKYFLTIVGDILLGKRGNVHFIDPSFKPFLGEFEHLLRIANKPILDYFKHKYSVHQYANSRVIPGKCKNGAFHGNPLDILAVATHYSRKYESADKFAATSPLRDTAFLLKNSTPATLVEKFVADYTTPSTGSVPFRHMYYMWRHFLHRNFLPLVIPRHTLKHILSERGMLDDDKCVNLSFKGKPSVLNFEQFWMNLIVPAPKSEFHVAELVLLYNGWCDTKSLHITEEEGAQWIAANCPPDTLSNIKCLLWDKTGDIDNAMEVFKYDPAYSACPREMYAFYCTYTKSTTKFLVPFDYFHQYISSI